jgi:hypothetical protein
MKKQNESSVQHSLHDTFSADALLRNPVSEQDIIAMQDMLLTNGVHHLSCTDSVTIRPVITRFLEALHHFQTIAFLSFDEPIEQGMSSLIYEQLYYDVASRIVDPDFIYDFILHELVCDFLWIEHHPSFSQFINVLLDLKIDKDMPILLVG